MLSLLKRKSEADSAAAQPAWHPDFRSREKLPDVKVVRTAFFVNAVAILLTVLLATYLGFREWNLRLINAQVAHLQSEIDRNKRASDQAVALYKKFQAEEAKVNEVDAFMKSKPLVSALIIRLAQTIPKNIAMDNLDLRDTGLTLRLSVRGDAAAASGYATAYLEQLRADKELAQFSDVTFTSTPTRNPGTGMMAVEFLLRSKPAGGKK
ncbi:MAG: hypothetical protein ACREH8_10545 [Opitutaceae bacterium]